MNIENELNTEEDVINLLTKITNMKSSLVEHVIHQHNNFEYLETEIKTIATNFVDVHKDAENIINKSAKVSEVLFLSIVDKEKYQKQINSLKSMKQIVMDLIDLNNHIHNLQTLANGEIILNAEILDKLSQELMLVNNKLGNSSSIRIQELKAYNILLSSISKIKKDLKSIIERLWEDNIHINRNDINPLFNYSDAYSCGDFVSHCKSLKITMSSSTLRSLIRLLYHLDVGRVHVDLLLRYISFELIFPAIENFSTFGIVTKVENNCFSFFSATKFCNSETKQQELIMCFIKDLTEMFSGLNDYLLSIEIPGRQISVLDFFQKQYFDFVLTDKLISFIFDEIAIDQTISTCLESFNTFLHDVRLINSSNRVLSDAILNSDRRARENDVTSLLGNARKLFLQSILDYRVINEDHSINKLEPESLLTETDEELFQSKLIDIMKVEFPVCKVSNVVIDFITSITETIDIFEAHARSNQTTETFEQMSNFVTMLPELIMMYLYVVPLSNKEVLSQLPLASVLHYNNCMHLAHYCLNWVTQVKQFVDIARSQTVTKLSPSEDTAFKMTPSCLLSLVYKFRCAATDSLVTEIDKQKSIISEFFKDFKSFQDIGGRNKHAVFQAVKQCHCHLSLLSKIYVGLPARLFEQAFGSVVDCATELVVANVLSMSDIVQVDNKQIITLLSEFRDRIIAIVVKATQHDNSVESGASVDPTEPVETSDAEAVSYLVECCPCWGKLDEVVFVLENSLKAIEDRWLDTDKRMARNIDPGDVKALIKAVFKNTSLRSKVLDKIV